MRLVGRAGLPHDAHPMTDSDEEARQALYLEGLALFGKDEHDAALVKYDKALALDPDWTEALHGKAMALMRLERYDEAIEVGLRIVELDPNDAFAHTSLSMFYQRKGMIEEAEAEGAKARMISWKEELKKNPDAPPPRARCHRRVRGAPRAHARPAARGARVPARRACRGAAAAERGGARAPDRAA